MSDYNFIRFFVILNEAKRGYGVMNSPSGYCKVESLNGNAVFTVSVRNLRPDDEPYKLYILLKNSDMPIYVGEIEPAQDGVVYKNYQTKASNVFQSGTEITMLEAMHILSRDNESILCGYINRNMTKQAQEYSDMKLKNLVQEEANSAFEAASTNMNDIQFETSLPDEIESSATPLETVELDETQAKESQPVENETASDNTAESENTNEQQNQNSANPLSSYVQTLARLYEGIVGAGNSSSKNDSAHEANAEKKESSDDTCSYWNEVGGYYSGLFDGQENYVPFDFGRNNSKWILINPSSNTIGAQLLGLVYENGNVKYIVNGIPNYLNCFVSPLSPCNMLWLPAKSNCNGIIGYWLTFIDAASGKLILPDISLL